MSALHFSDDFFEGEERCGFYVEPLMKRSWAATMEVFEVVRSICKKYDIHFFTYYGTTLGAVRHQGFIPWDDDMDIAMFREDMIRFMKVARTELPEGYVLVNCQDDATWVEALIRVVNSKRPRVDGEFLEEFHGCPFVVGIDIFPIDYIPENEEEREFQTNILQIIRQTRALLMADEKYTKEYTDGLLEQVEQVLGRQLDRDGNLVQQLTNLIEAVSAMYGPADSNLAGVLYTQTYRPKEAVINQASWFEKTIEMPFENTTVPVVTGYENYLRNEYGEDYMSYKIMVEHDYPFYKRQIQKLKDAFAKESLTLADFGIPDIIRKDLSDVVNAQTDAIIWGVETADQSS